MKLIFTSVVIIILLTYTNKILRRVPKESGMFIRQTAGRAGATRSRMARIYAWMVKLEGPEGRRL